MSIRQVLIRPLSFQYSDIGKYRDEPGDAAEEVIRSGTIERVELKNEYKILAERIARFPRVDRGEAEALALCYQINAKELVIDDVDAIGGLVGISKIRQKSFKRVSNKKRVGTERFACFI